MRLGVVVCCIACAGEPSARSGLGEDEPAEFVVASMTMLEEPPNALAAVAPLMSPFMQQEIENGNRIILVVVFGLEAPTGDGNVELRVYEGVDTDGVPGNNLDGWGELDVAPGHEPIVTNAIVEGDRLTAHASHWGGPVPLVEVTLEAVLSEDRRRSDGLLTGGTTSRDMAGGPAAPNSDLSALDVTVANYGVQPDLDLDGDGLETFEANQEGRVDLCRDGDGTVNRGTSCPFDPAFADAYSLAVEIAVVHCEIAGEL